MQDKSEKYTKRRKYLMIASAIAFILLVIAAIAAWIHSLIYSAKVEIRVAPKEQAKIIIGDRTYSNIKTHDIKPGTYNVIISAEGFVEDRFQIEAKAGETTKVYRCLAADENNGDYYDNNSEDYQLCFEINQLRAEALQNEQLSGPIYQITPYHSYKLGFNIDPKHPTETGDDGKIIVSITTITCNENRALALRENALDWLKKRSIDLENYNFEYISGCE